MLQMAGALLQLAGLSAGLQASGLLHEASGRSIVWLSAMQACSWSGRLACSTNCLYTDHRSYKSYCSLLESLVKIDI